MFSLRLSIPSDTKGGDREIQILEVPRSTTVAEFRGRFRDSASLVVGGGFLVDEDAILENVVADRTIFVVGGQEEEEVSRVSDVSPRCGRVEGGGVCVLRGSGLGSRTRIWFGGKLAEVVEIFSDTKLSVVVPRANVPGTVPVTCHRPSSSSPRSPSREGDDAVYTYAASDDAFGHALAATRRRGYGAPEDCARTEEAARRAEKETSPDVPFFSPKN